MTGNVEDIIKNKQYFELSGEELSAVSEYAKTEEEYEDMKWFLLNVGEAMQGSKIEASTELKGRVMERLASPQKAKGGWMSSATVFLFPEDKRFYQKPAFQMFAAAAVIILGIFILDPFSGMDDKTGMAVNDSQQEEESAAEDNFEGETVVAADSIAGAREQNLIIEDFVNIREKSEEVDGRASVEDGPADDWASGADGAITDFESAPAEEMSEEESVDEDAINTYNWDDNNATGNESGNTNNSTTVGGLSSSGSSSKGTDDLRKDSEVDKTISTGNNRYYSNGDLKDGKSYTDKTEDKKGDFAKGKKKSKALGGGGSKRDEAIAAGNSELEQNNKPVVASNDSYNTADSRTASETGEIPGKKNQQEELKTIEKLEEETVEREIVSEIALEDTDGGESDELDNSFGYASKEKELAKNTSNKVSISNSKELRSLFFTVK